MPRRSIPTILVSIFGLLLIFIAVFANLLGLDHNAGWGRVRIITLMVGLGITLGAIYAHYHANQIGLLLRSGRSFLKHIPPVASILRRHDLNEQSRLWRAYRFTLPFFALVIVLYVWFVSAGTWTTWISPTRYYADLARGFQRGHLYLPNRVDPQLLQLADPYDPSSWGEVDAPLDITFYHGKYYLYWGPVPALMLAGIQSFFHGRVGDLFAVFGFVCGIFLSQFFLLVTIWDGFFRDLPKWLLFASILLAGLAGPTTFMLDHINSARIYEAAVTGGQFFLMSGILVVVSNSSGFSSDWRLALTGFLWTLAIGTRFTLMAPVGVMTLMIAFRILRSDRNLFRKITKLFCLGLPLALGLMCLGWYNWARFGSVTETGYYYQLAGPHLQKYYDILFHPAYILQNLYNYLLHPVQINSQFPFIHATYGNAKAIFASYSLPGIYSAQVMTGILCLVPFVAFAAIPPGLAVYDRLRGIRTEEPVVEGRPPAVRWITCLLGTAGLFAFVMLLFFFWAGMRYSEDFMPALIVLSVIGFWQGYQLLARNPTRRKLYAAVGVLLAIASILISLLTALSVNDARFTISRLF